MRGGVHFRIDEFPDSRIGTIFIVQIKAADVCHTKLRALERGLWRITRGRPGNRGPRLAARYRGLEDYPQHERDGQIDGGLA
jgi:hypothetical protein